MRSIRIKKKKIVSGNLIILTKFLKERENIEKIEVTIYIREYTTRINKAPVNNSGHLYQAHLLPNKILTCPDPICGKILITVFS